MWHNAIQSVCFIFHLDAQTQQLGTTFIPQTKLNEIIWSPLTGIKPPNIKPEQQFISSRVLTTLSLVRFWHL